MSSLYGAAAVLLALAPTLATRGEPEIPGAGAPWVIPGDRVAESPAEAAVEAAVVSGAADPGSPAVEAAVASVEVEPGSAVVEVARALERGEPARALRLAGAALETAGPADAPLLSYVAALAERRLGRREAAARRLAPLTGAGAPELPPSTPPGTPPSTPPGLPADLQVHAAWYLGEAALAPPGVRDPALRRAGQEALGRVPLDGRFGAEARLLLVRSLLRDEQHAEACRLASEALSALELHRREPELRVERARCEERLAREDWQQGRRDESRARLVEAATLYREVAVRWPSRPSAEVAEAALSRLAARRIRPAPADAEAVLARAREIAGRSSSARAVRALLGLRRLVATGAAEPAPNEIDLLLAELSQRRRKHRMAWRLYARVRRRAADPELQARAELGLVTLATRRRSSEAFEKLVAVADAFPETRASAEALHDAGERARRRGHTEEAAATFRRCLQLSSAPETERACRWGLAWTLHGAGRLDDAQGQLSLLTGAPGREGERARYWHARIDETHGRLGPARAAYGYLAAGRPYAWYPLLALERLERLRAEAEAAPADSAPADSAPADAAPADAAPADAAPADAAAADAATADATPADATPADAAPADAAPADAAHPDVLAARLYLRLGLRSLARDALRPLHRDALAEPDRREASRLHTALGDLRRAHRMAPVPWEGGLPGLPGLPGLLDGPEDPLAADAALAYPQAFASVVEGPARDPAVPPALVYALMRAESAFHPAARSPAGALGLTQVIRPTAYRTARRIGLEPFNYWMLTEPEVSVQVGSAYLAWLLRLYGGHVALALAAYNGGEKAVDRWLLARGDLPLDAFVEEIPFAETNRYVRKVMSFYAIYRALYDEPRVPVRVELDLPASARDRAAADRAHGRLPGAALRN